MAMPLPAIKKRRSLIRDSARSVALERARDLDGVARDRLVPEDDHAKMIVERVRVEEQRLAFALRNTQDTRGHRQDARRRGT